jgi:predicted transcriptional regulator
MRKLILEMVDKGHIHWTDLKKKILGTCYAFATDATFAAQIRYLLNVGMIHKESRGIYVISDKGQQYLKIMS